MESQNFGHEHPLLLLNEELINNGSERVVCWRCGEKVSAPSLSCVDCGFYLHKKCAELPSEISHPFHRVHPLVLRSPYGGRLCTCDFCGKRCERFVYHCSCGLDFHIKCALFTYNIAEKNFKELELVAPKDTLISTVKGFGDEDLEKCFRCWEPLANYTYFSLDCGFNLHKKCADLPPKINHMCHRKHPLILQFNSERRSCKICQETQRRRGLVYRRRGLVYCCSPCRFVVHIECASPPPIIENKSHQHPFTLFWRQSSFICDGCGTDGKYEAYICCTCNIIVHKRCISLPRIIKSWWHDHRLFHSYFLHREAFTNLNCIKCNDEVDTERGNYYCAGCNIIFHVNCATKETYWYDIISTENQEEQSYDTLADLSDIYSITVIERNDVGEATKIKHFKHIHNLMLQDKITENGRRCDGCVLPISASFYSCSECDFFLHKACAELPKMKRVWFHDCQQYLILTSGYIFRCEICDFLCNGFAYKCGKCNNRICLRCVTTLIPGAQTCQGHEHPLFLYYKHEGQCSACGQDVSYAFCCKDCNFALDLICTGLPNKARHQCDEHLLRLAYHDDNEYSDSHYCDSCEEIRDPNLWFYHCATCDTSAHVDCVLGDYPFIKVGSIYNEGNHHPHPLTFVKKIHVYLDCSECGELCQDLALECAMSGCNYIVHYKCIAPIGLRGKFY